MTKSAFIKNYSQGTLMKNEQDDWVVKWSDLHTFSQGYIWSFTPLAPESNAILYISDNQVLSKPLEEGETVQFEDTTIGDDGLNFTTLWQAKLVFPEVEAFQTSENIKQYIKECNGRLFSFNKVSVIRDGGTTILITGNKHITFYIHKDNKTLHNGYPTTDENMVTDTPTKTYVLHQIQLYQMGCKDKVELANKIIKQYSI